MQLLDLFLLAVRIDSPAKKPVIDRRGRRLHRSPAERQAGDGVPPAGHPTAWVAAGVCRPSPACNRPILGGFLFCRLSPLSYFCVFGLRTRVPPESLGGRQREARRRPATGNSPASLADSNQLVKLEKPSRYNLPSFFMPSFNTHKMVMLKIAARSLRRRFLRSKAELKEGHFAVLATHEANSKRFVVPLSCLRNPAFVRLLDEAQEEYGFCHQNILTVPCDPAELENILARDQWRN
ncbi:hypothetical protein EJ110_NYTH12810 [Nymphaea thermarum]|nr:hypothetical protein EJ110_NYTH12810 [Nymphaea thermarum]